MAKDKIVLAKLDIDVSALLKGANASKKALSEIIDELNSLRAAGQETSLHYTRLAGSMKELTKILEGQVKALKETADKNNELATAQRDVAKAATESAGAQNTLANSLNNTSTTQEKLASVLETTANLLDGLEDAAEDAGDAFIEFNSVIGQSNAIIAEADTATKNHGKTFNDYKKLFKDSVSDLDIFNGGLGDFISKAQEAGGVGPLLKKSFEGMATGIGGMTKSALTFMATPLGIVLAAIAAVVALVQNSMDRGTEASGRITKVFTTFSVITDRLLKLLEPLADFLIDGIAAGFELAGKAAEAAMGWIADGLSFLGFEESAANVKEFTAEIKATAAETGNLKAAQEKLAAQMVVQEVNNEKAKQQIDELKKKYEDQTASEQDRIEALKKASAIEQDNLNQRKSLTDEAYNLAVRNAAHNKGLTVKEIAELQKQGAAYAEKMMKVKGFSQEEIDALKKAHVEKLRISGEETQMLKNQSIAQQKIYEDSDAKRDAAAQKARAKQAERAQKLQDVANAEVARQKLELDIFIEAQGTKARTMKEELELAEKIAARKKDIALAEYNASAKTENDKLALKLTNSKITNDLAKAQMNAAFANAQKELDNIREKNASEIKEGQFLSEELYKAEQAKLDNIAKAEQDFQAERLAREIISKETYDAEIKKIDEKNEADKKALAAKRTQDENTEKLLKLDNDRAQAGIAFDYDLAAQLDQIEQKRAIELSNENLTDEQKREINKKYDDDRKAAEKEVMNNKLALAQGAFTNMAAILGKESAASKAMAVAQATIDTYKSAVSAYSSMSGIPIVGPALGAVAAAAAVAAGIANVKKITSTKAPKAEKGALFSIGGKRHSEGGTLFTGADGTQFEAEQGELIGVMNRNAARHFMAFNNAFPARGTSAPNYFAGGGIVSREMSAPALNTDELAMKIAVANRALPAPVVAVQDIVTEGNSYVKVRDMANF